MSETGIRINKYLADCGVCSRRDADRLIESGVVTLNGSTATNGDRVDPGDRVNVRGKELSPLSQDLQSLVYAYYKPVGVTCTERDPHAAKKVLDGLELPTRVTYAGRLDKDSEGLLLLTNDGNLIDRLMRGANRHEKEYVVRVNREITEAFVERMQAGMYLKDLDATTRPCSVHKESKFTFRIVLTQGLNRQIRRMCKTLGYEVTALKRVRVQNVVLGDLRPGAIRQITGEELNALYGSVQEKK